VDEVVVEDLVVGEVAMTAADTVAAVADTIVAMLHPLVAATEVAIEVAVGEDMLLTKSIGRNVGR
jgi:hypothetical protein